jgi:thiamine biosynthesis lipoprotein
VKRALAAVALVALQVCVARAETAKESHPLLGGVLDITVEAEDAETAQNRIRDAVVVAHRIEAMLDLDAGESAVSRLNQQAGRDSIQVPLDLYRLLFFSRLMTRSTGGAFDVTVGPLLHRRQGMAGGQRINVTEALDLVGADKIALTPPDHAELEDAGMSVDFAAVARGYMMQRMADSLREAGVTRALLEFGDTTVLAIGPPAGEPPFRIQVRHGKSTAGSVALRDRAMSTTRSHRRGEESTIAPVVDPRSGRYVDAERQATVIARDAAIAEAWSTAFVVDPDGCLGLLDEPRDVEALVFDEHGEHRSPRFADFSGWKPPR